MVGLVVLGASLSLYARAFSDGDPLANAVVDWGESIEKLCGTVPFASTLEEYPWDAEASSLSDECRDDPALALCYLARYISQTKTCQEGTTKYGLCKAFPDATQNYCCQSATQYCEDGEGATSSSSEAQAEGQTNVIAAREYLPTLRKLKSRIEHLAPGNKRQLAQISQEIFDYVTVFLFEDRINTCTRVQSLWRTARVLIMFLDMDSLWSGVNDAGPLTVPSPSLANPDADTRFIDQFGPSQTFRKLGDCGGLARMMGDLMDATSDFFGGRMKIEEYAKLVADSIDDSLILIDAEKAKVTYAGARAGAKFAGLVTPGYIMMPPCMGGASDLLKNVDSLDDIQINIPKLVRQSAKDFRAITEAIQNCDECTSKVWRKIVSIVNEGEFDPEATDAEGERLKSLGFKFMDSLMAELDGKEDSELPQTFGGLVEQFMVRAANSMLEEKTSLGSLIEVGLLVLDALQRELSGETDDSALQDLLRWFLSEKLQCAATTSFGYDDTWTFDRGRRLKEETQPARKLQHFAWDDDDDEAVTSLDGYSPDIFEDFMFNPLEDAAYNRQLGRNARFQSPSYMQEPHIPYPNTKEEPLRSAQAVDSSVDNVLITTSGHGNLLASLENPEDSSQNSQPVPIADPLTGYECRDQLSSMFVDFFTPWLERASCKDLIAVTGCAGKDSPVVPLTMILHSCPQTWVEMCRSGQSLSFLRAMIAEETPEDDLADSITDEDEADSRLQAFIAQLPNRVALTPLRNCLSAQTVRRNQRANADVFEDEKQPVLEGSEAKAGSLPSIASSVLSVLAFASILFFA